MKKLIALILLTCVLALSLVSCGDTPPADTTTAAPDANEVNYNTAVAYLSEGKYAEAYAILVDLGDYKDVADYFARLRYFPTKVDYKVSGEVIATLTATLGANKLPTTMVGTYGETSETATYTYNEAGRIVGVSYVDGAHTSSIAITYDANGNETLRTYYEDGVVSYADGKVYNEAGLLVEVYYTDEEGAHHTEYTYAYDAAGNLVSEVQHMDGEEYETVYTYDAAGKLIKKEITEYGGYVTKEEYTYNDKGLLAKATHYYDDVKDEEIVYTYDEKGNEIESVQTYFGEDDDTSVTRKVSTYDADGYLLKAEIRADGDEVAYKMEYTYDAAHNLTSETISLGDISQGLEKEYVLVYLDAPLSDEVYEAILAEFAFSIS